MDFVIYWLEGITNRLAGWTYGKPKKKADGEELGYCCRRDRHKDKREFQSG